MKNIEAEKKEASGILQLVSFKIGHEEFGINILKVQEINKTVQITKIPNAPSFVEGIINPRGRVIPVISLRKRLGLSEKDFNKNTRIIIVEMGGKTLGFIVDQVSEVLRISEELKEVPPDIITRINSSFLVSVIKLEDRLLLLLDFEKILSIEESRLAESFSYRK